MSAYSNFSANPSLRNIVNGTVKKEEVNVHEYELVGNTVMHRMLGEPVFSFALKKIYKVKLMSSSCVPRKIIDPSSLFNDFF